jgi:hypothetical protein
MMPIRRKPSGDGSPPTRGALETLPVKGTGQGSFRSLVLAVTGAHVLADCPAWVFARSVLLVSEVLSSDLLLSTERLLYSAVSSSL